MKNYRSIVLALLLIFLCAGRTRQEQSRHAGVPYKEVVCFVYHRFGDARYPSTNIEQGTFESQLTWLMNHDYQVLSLSAAIAYLQSDQPAKKKAVLTIDDGFKSFYTNGLPLLKKYNMPATLFINTETVGGGDYMDWDDLRAVAQLGVEIGNHTHSHAYFLNDPEATRYTHFKEELEQSQQLFDEHLGIVPKVFAYPYGEFDSKMKEIVEHAGFVGGAAQNSGVINNDTDLFQIPRFPMSQAFASIDKFAEKARMHALPVSHESPASFIMDTPRPQLQLTIPSGNLLLDQLQCFIQGDECQVKVISEDLRETTLTLQSVHPLTRRRTLYTLTIPDMNGAWHWHSHLFINTKARE